MVLDFDAVVIGAGISGMYQIYKLRQIGLSVRGIEASDGIGGVWHQNRYPGCRVDSESFTYAYTWSQEIIDGFDWSERFASQPEVLEYLNYAADVMDIRKDILFNTRVKQLTWNEQNKFWTIELTEGGSAPMTARYVFSAVGPLSAAQMPKIPGIHSFAGESYQTSKWPRDPNGFGGADVSFDGKRVGVIGTGSTGVQVIQEVAKTAHELYVFQLAPNWCTPLGNSKISSEEMQRIRNDLDTIIGKCSASPTSFMHVWTDQDMSSVSAEEREELFERLYNGPGFSFWLGNYRDSLVDPEANKHVSEFVARKIRERVKDPTVAEKLIPKDHGFGTRRIPLETNYFEAYNQNNVFLVDISENAISSITKNGINTRKCVYELDTIIYATGFDAIVGSYNRMEVIGRSGVSLKDVWMDGVKSHLGLQVSGFPNFFMLVGPQNGSLFCNIPRCSATAIEWLTKMISYSVERGFKTIESPVSVQDNWTETCNDLMHATLIGSTDSWFTGVNPNIEGRDKRSALFYAGPNPEYRRICDEIERNEYNAFEFN